MPPMCGPLRVLPRIPHAQGSSSPYDLLRWPYFEYGRRYSAHGRWHAQRDALRLMIYTTLDFVVRDWRAGCKLRGRNSGCGKSHWGELKEVLVGSENAARWRRRNL